jgi:hypothetical protein
MKQFTLTLAILCAFGALTFAGTERSSGKDKEVMQPAPPPCDWYRANEWNLAIWGTYAFPGNTGSPDLLPDFIGETATSVIIEETFDVGSAYNDRFINRSGAWGGGADIKYFFTKYIAAGAEGFVLDCNDNPGGAALGTFTFRYPIGCSRFAPYAWAGVGGAFGGSHEDQFVHLSTFFPDEEETVVATSSKSSINNTHAEAMGQFGTGLEIRLIHPSEKCKIGVGVMADFAWNVVSGPNNNFGMARFGLNFNY